jgi:uncharacterized membrane protein
MKTMDTKIKEASIRRIFYAGMIIKGIDGFLETVGGVLLFLIRPDQLAGIIRFLTQKELVEDPKDAVIAYLLNASHYFSVRSELFIAAYLLANGLVKIVIVMSLLKNKLWAYPLGITLFSAFVGYQVYQYAQSGSPVILVFMCFDVLVIALTWHEYRVVRRHLSL